MDGRCSSESSTYVVVLVLMQVGEAGTCRLHPLTHSGGSPQEAISQSTTNIIDILGNC